MAKQNSSGFKTAAVNDFFDLGQDLGSGKYAVVKACTERASGHEYAIKFIRKKKTAGGRRGATVEDIQNEVAILSELNHDNIIKLYDVFETGSEVMLILELVSGGELFNYLSERETITEEEATLFLTQILHAVRHMHERHVAHLDLKPENVMLQSPDSHRIKIIDFGLSRRLLPGKDVKDMIGTPEFVAPEVINYEPLRLSTDMWSIGVLTYIMLSGASPFLGDDLQDTYRRITGVRYEFDQAYFSQTSKLAKDFIRKLLVKNPKGRLTVQEALQHPFIEPRREEERLIKRMSSINVENLKSFVARKRWRQSLRVISLCNLLAKSHQTLSIAGTSLARHGRSAGGFSSSTDLLYTKSELFEGAEGSYVMAALFCGAEDGAQLATMKRLIDCATTVDLNKTNRHGETLLHIAAGNGQLSIIEYLKDKQVKVEVRDKHGDTALCWAARQGHVDVVAFLHQCGALLDSQNKAGETALHLSTRYEHVAVVEFLCQSGANVNLQDKLGETALHNAAWHGSLRVAVLLTGSGCKCDTLNKEGETALHVATMRGNLDCVRALLDAGASPNVYDKRGNTCLHLACRRHTDIACLLVEHGDCDLDLVDGDGSSALHIAAEDGHAVVVQSLCSFNGSVNLPNKIGFTPLHLAAKSGHVEVVRQLLIHGANPVATNKDGMRPDILAVAQGHMAVVEILRLVKSEERREQLVRQLDDGTEPIRYIKMKLFGDSGVGKTRLLECLKAGYISSFFKSWTAAASPPQLPSRSSGIFSDGIGQLISGGELYAGATVAGTYTRGIAVEEISIASDCYISAWEFSGYDRYRVAYDHFVGDSSSIHAVLFSLQDSIERRMESVTRWLNFLRLKIEPQEPIGHCGKLPNALPVMLIATHADVINCPRDSRGEYVCAEASTLLIAMRQKFKIDFDFCDRLFVLNVASSSTPELKSLKNYLRDLKNMMAEELPTATGLYQATLAEMGEWQRVDKSAAAAATSASSASSNGGGGGPQPQQQAAAQLSAPFVTWKQFGERIRQCINPLASDEVLHGLLYRLEASGRVALIRALEGREDLVVLDPNWLCGRVIGTLLSREQVPAWRHSASASLLPGCYSRSELAHVLGPDVDVGDAVAALEALDLCVSFTVDDVEFVDVPCTNLAPPPPLELIWQKAPLADLVYAGVSLAASPGEDAGASGATAAAAGDDALGHTFARLQTQLRRTFVQECGAAAAGGGGLDGGGGGRLEQWHGCSRYAFASMQALVVLDSRCGGGSGGGGCVELRARGPRDAAAVLFYFLDNLVALATHVFAAASPGLSLRRAYLSPSRLTEHIGGRVHRYEARDVFAALLAGRAGALQVADNSHESFSDVVCCGSSDVEAALVPGPALHASVALANAHLRRRLCAALDAPDPLGRDWCVLAVNLRLPPQAVAELDAAAGPGAARSRTDRLLDEWCRDPDATLGSLVSRLVELGRADAADVIMSLSPLYDVRAPAEDDDDPHRLAGGGGGGAHKASAAATPSFPSSNTLSNTSLSR